MQSMGRGLKTPEISKYKYIYIYIERVTDTTAVVCTVNCYFLRRRLFEYVALPFLLH
jgi:hypothetical protein